MSNVIALRPRPSRRPPELQETPLDRLIAGIEAQKRELAEFRATMTCLRDRMAALRASLDTYDRQLGAIPVGRLRAETLKLAARMDGAA